MTHAFTALARPAPESAESSASDRDELEVNDDVIAFPHGLFGFPECRRFVLRATARDGLFWLQSVEHEHLAFLLADPFRYFEDYSVELGDAELADLEPSQPSDIVVLAIVTLGSPDDQLTTVNLQGPITINLRRRRGRQIVLADSDYGVRTPVEL